MEKSITVVRDDIVSYLTFQCNSRLCPDGISCPFNGYGCEEVTEEMWDEALGVKSENDR